MRYDPSSEQDGRCRNPPYAQRIAPIAESNLDGVIAGQTVSAVEDYQYWTIGCPGVKPDRYARIVTAPRAVQDWY